MTSDGLQTRYGLSEADHAFLRATARGDVGRLTLATILKMRLGWLTGLPDPGKLLEGISHSKLRQFAAETAALEPGELLDMSQQGKRHTLLLSLIRRVRRTQAAAKERLAALQGRLILSSLACRFTGSS